MNKQEYQECVDNINVIEPIDSEEELEEQIEDVIEEEETVEDSLVQIEEEIEEVEEELESASNVDEIDELEDEEETQGGEHRQIPQGIEKGRAEGFGGGWFSHK